MTVLIILLALGVSHYAGVHLQGIKRRVIHLAFARVRHLLGFPGGVLLAVVVPAVAVGALEWWLWQSQSPLAGFLFSSAVLIWAWGSRDLDGDVQDYLTAEGPEARTAAAQPLLFAGQSAGGTDVGDEEQRDTPDVVRGVFYQGLTRWFGTMFWFLLGGVGAALAYRISQDLMCESANRELLSGDQRRFMQRWISLINWPAAVLSTLALMVVGDFDRGMDKVRGVLDGRRSVLRWDWEVLTVVGCANAVDGEDLDDAFRHDYGGELGQVNSAMSLLWRVLVCWLTVIAIIQLTVLMS